MEMECYYTQCFFFFFFFVIGLQPIAPKFKMTSPQYLAVDKSGWIHCKVASDPPAKFFWSKSNPWPFGDRLDKLEFVPISNGSLFVRKAKKSYEGDFYCTAVNSGGRKSSSINIKVEGECKVRYQKSSDSDIFLTKEITEIGKRFNS